MELTMRDKLFQELLESVRQMNAIELGKLKPGRRYTAAEILGPERMALVLARRGTGLTQHGFAEVVGVSPRTVEQWEQGRRKPSGAARTLIHVMAAHPEIVIETVAKVKALKETRRPPKFVARVAKRGRPKKAKTG
jgi:putative transcriptional regulator